MKRATQDSAYKKSKNRRSEAGNIFFTLFGAVAVVGVLGAGIMATMRGPLSTMVEVNRLEQAKSEMRVNSRLILVASDAGTCDGDPLTEGVDPDTGGSCASNPTGGGCIPAASSASKLDPWGTPYGYCAWNHGSTTTACGNVLAGSGDTNNIALALISAGPDRTFNTTCAADPTYVPSEALNDDIMIKLSYNDAAAGSGGLWSLDITATKAEITKDLNVTGGATFTDDIDLSTTASAQLKLGAASMVLPNQATLATCNGANDQLLRINTATTPDTVEICDNANGGWANVATGSLSSIWTDLGGNQIHYGTGGTGQVGIGTNAPDDSLDVNGNIGTTGNIELTGNLEIADASSVVWTSGADITENSGAIEIDANGGSLELIVGNDTITIDGDTSIKGTTDNNTAAGLNVTDSSADSILYVRNDGKVGINDNSPSQALDVTGDTNVTDTYMIRGNTVVAATDTATDNTILLGNAAGANITAVGDNNTILGGGAAATLIIGTGNIVIGQGADVPLAATSNYLNIGDTITGNLSSGDVVIANDITAATGILTTLDVSGNGDIDGILEADDYTWGGIDFTPADCDGTTDKIGWDASSGWVCNTDQQGGSGGGAPDLDDVLSTGNNAGTRTAINLGGVAIGSATLSTGGTQDLELDVTGDIGATNYCAADGNTCFTSADVVAGIAIDTFPELTDTPANYTGSGTYLLRVNAGATAVEFVDPSTVTTAATAPGNDREVIFNNSGALGTDTAFTFPEDGNLKIGVDAFNNFFIEGGNTTTIGQLNTALGANALDSLDSTCAVGSDCDSNTAVGYNALTANTTGNQNTAIGQAALSSNTTADNNVAIGVNTLRDNTTGNQNVAIGMGAATLNTEGLVNVAIGHSTLLNNTTGDYNVAIGGYAGQGTNGATDGVRNVFVGHNSGLAFESGGSNTFIGYNTGTTLTDGSRNILMGNDVSLPTATTDDYLSIGNLIYGDLANNEVFLDAPAAAAPDGDLANGQLTFWVDAANDEIELKAKDSAGDIISVTVGSGAGLNAPGNDREVIFNDGGSLGTDTAFLFVGDGNLKIGVDAFNNFFIEGGNTTTIGANNVAIGLNALDSLDSTCAGADDCDDNTAIGYEALTANTTGHHNTGVGFRSLATNTTGIRNTAMGYASLFANDDGNHNTAVGRSALHYNSSGVANTGMGHFALSSNTTGFGNTALGYNAGAGVFGTTVTNHNVFIGYHSGYAIETGGNNTFIGYLTGDSVTDGARNILIGNDIDTPLATTNDYLNIGGILFGDRTAASEKIGAHQYCDENLANCFEASAVGTDATQIADGDTIVAVDNSTPEITFDVNGTEEMVINATTLDAGSLNITTTGNVGGTDATFTGDLTVPDDGLFMATTNTAGHMLINNGTSFNPVAMSGDATIASDGALTIAADAVEHTMLNVAADATAGEDEYCLTYEHGTTNFAWQDCNTGGLTVPGLDREVIFNDGGSLGTDTAFLFVGDGKLDIGVDSNTNLFIQGGNTTTAGVNNVALGEDALDTLSNTCVGADDCDKNVAIGNEALTANTTGYQNIAMGWRSLYKNTTGVRNTGIGHTVLFNNLDGSSNTALGRAAAFSNTSGSENVVIGRSASYYNTTADRSIIIGYQAGNGSSGNTDADHNILIGYQSGLNVQSGGNNTFLGYSTGSNVTDGAGNILIGYDIDLPLATTDNRLNIGGILFGDMTGASEKVGAHQYCDENLINCFEATAVGTATPGGNDTEVQFNNSGALDGDPGMTFVAATNILTTTGGMVSVDGTLTGDLTIPDDGLFMATTNTAGHMLINDGTNFNPVAMSGDATIASTGALTIAADAVEHTMLNVVADATIAEDEYCLTYEHGTTNFAWQSCNTGAVAVIDDLTDAYADYTTLNNLILGRSSAAALTAGAQFNVFIGEGAGATSGNSTAAADFNSAIGYGAMAALTSGDGNTAVGMEALASLTTGRKNTAVGKQALTANVGGIENTAVGQDSMTGNISGQQNVAVGKNSLEDNTVGNYNVAMGRSALASNVAKSKSTALGYQAMAYADSTVTPGDSNNTAVGYQALYGSTTAANNVGVNNTVLGTSAMLNNEAGDNNIAIGYQTGDLNTDGSNNILIGYDIDAPLATTSSHLNIGNLIYGDIANNEVFLDAPAAAAPDGDLANGQLTFWVDAANDEIELKAKDSAGDIINVTVGSAAAPGSDREIIFNDGGSAFGTDSAFAFPEAGTLDIGLDAFSNMFIQGGNTTTIGQNNVGIGFGALDSLDSTCAAANTCHSNTAVGYNAMTSNTLGFRNSAFGLNALYSNTDGSSNTAMGYGAMDSNVGGDENTGIGYSALQTNTTGGKNTGIGFAALYNFETGTGNTALGASAGLGAASASGNSNVFLGRRSGLAIDGGDNNVFVGYQAGDSVTDGTANILIGYDVDAPTATTDSHLNIGNLIYGDLANNEVFLDAPAAAAGDSDLANGQLTFWVDAANDEIELKAKDSAGDIINVTVGSAAAPGSDREIIFNDGGSAFGTDSAFAFPEAGTLDIGLDAFSNMFIQGGNTTTIGIGNLGIGGGTLQVLDSTCAGSQQCNYNTAVGYRAMERTTTGYRNTALGYAALFNNATGALNTAVGWQALGDSTDATENTAIGYYAMHQYGSGEDNVAVGYNAGYGTASATGDRNVFIGRASGLVVDGGDNNVFVGYQAGDSVTDGTGNILLGYDVDTPAATTDSHLNIGNLIYGDIANNEVFVDAPAAAAPDGDLANGQLTFWVDATNDEIELKAKDSAGDIINVTVGSGSGATVIDDLTDAYADYTTLNNLIIGRSSAAALTAGAQFNVFIGENAGATSANSTSATDSNTAIGYDAMAANTSGFDNTAVGFEALTANLGGSDNVAVGKQALAGNLTGVQNVGVGHDALENNTAGNYNVAMGENALTATTASGNTAIGTNVMTGNTVGTGNVAMGYHAADNNVAKSKSTAIGYEAMRYADSTTTPGDANNTALGYRALYGSTTAANNTGVNNVALGASALLNNEEGSNNIAIGFQTGDLNTDGDDNILIGYDIDAPLATTSDYLNIGNLIYGDLANNEVFLDAPAAAAPDGDLANGQLTFWVDAANDEIELKAKDSAGDLINVTVGAVAAPGSDREIVFNDGGSALGTDSAFAFPEAGTLDIGVDAFNNMFIQGGNTTTIGTQNLAIGPSALDSLDATCAAAGTCDNNVAIGYNALTANTTGYVNSAFGANALLANTTGDGNTAIGYYALGTNTTGTANTAVGHGAAAVSDGTANNAFGRYALRYNTSGAQNVALGYAAGQGVNGVTATSNNVLVGNSSGYLIETGGNNVLVGYAAGYNIADGDNNLILGYSTGSDITDGSNNILLGYNIELPTATTDSYLSIGNLIYGDIANNEIFLDAPAAAAPDGDLANGQLTFWVDAANDEIELKAKDSAGDIINVTVGSATAPGNDREIVFNDGGSALGTDSAFQFVEAGTLDIGTDAEGNMFIQGGNTTTIGISNVGIGPGALDALDSTCALANQCDSNTGVGLNSLGKNTTGYRNSAFGSSSLLNNTSGWLNTAMGYLALGSNSTGNTNVAVGYYALGRSSTGTDNVGVGNQAGYATASATGNRNVFIGSKSGQLFDAGNNNTFIGHQTGDSVTDGSDNILIGYNIDAPTATTNSYLNIGDLIYGDLANNEVFLDAPAAAAPDGDLANGQLTFWVDATNDEIELKAKDSAGDIINVTVGGGGGSSVWTDNTTYATYETAHIVNAGETLPAALDDNGDRMFWYSDKSAFRAGSISGGNDAWQEAKIGDHSYAFGLNAQAEGNYSFVVATDAAATAIGYGSIILGGGTTNADASYSIAFNGADMLGAYSYGFGASAYVSGDNSFVVGANSEVTSDDTAVFNFTNAYWSFANQDTFAVLGGKILVDDATTGSNGCIRYDGGDSKLQFSHDCSSYTDFGSGGGASTNITDGDTIVAVVDATPEITFDVNGTEEMVITATALNAGSLNVSTTGTLASGDLTVSGDIDYSGVLTDTSDRRLKTDITPLNTDEILTKIAKIDTYSFRMKDDENGRLEFGVMAQELEEHFPELVHTADDEMGTKSVNYIGLITPLIEASKTLKTENDTLKAELEATKAQNEDILASLETLKQDVNGLKIHTGFDIRKATYENGLFLMIMLMFGGGAFVYYRSRQGSSKPNH